MQCKVQQLNPNNNMRIFNKQRNWVQYIQEQNLKKVTKNDVLLDKVLSIAEPLGRLYQLSDLHLYCSDKTLHIEYIFDKQHLFINMIPIKDIEPIQDKCDKLLQYIIKGLNEAKFQVKKIEQ